MTRFGTLRSPVCGCDKSGWCVADDEDGDVCWWCPLCETIVREDHGELHEPDCVIGRLRCSNTESGGEDPVAAGLITKQMWKRLHAVSVYGPVLRCTYTEFFARYANCGSIELVLDKVSAEYKTVKKTV